MTFEDLGLSPGILKALERIGHRAPTPIQEQAIPPALEGHDVLGIAQTGTGKTAAFLLPMLMALSKGRARARMPRSVVLCPTRELAVQAAESLEGYGKGARLVTALLIGGVSFRDQSALIDRGADILIATPGRLLDHAERGRLLLTGVQILVIDEADRMLDMGFIPDVERICHLLPGMRQTMLFSATMPDEITKLARNFMRMPVRIEVAPPATTVDRVEQRLVPVPGGERSHEGDRLAALLRELNEPDANIANAIIFCNRKQTVRQLHKALTNKGVESLALHGDLPQSQRLETLASFRNSEFQLLIASDVAARGLDIPTVSHVFNFEVPRNSDDYVHRIGRTARAGRPGMAVTLCKRHEERYLRDIEKHIGVTLDLPDPEAEVPDAGPAETLRSAAKAETGDPRPARTERRARPKAAAPKPPAGRQRGRDRRSADLTFGNSAPAFLLRGSSVAAARNESSS